MIDPSEPAFWWWWLLGFEVALGFVGVIFAAIYALVATVIARGRS